MKLAVRQALSCSVLILAAATAGYAQSISAGTIEGTVTDPTGAAIGKAAVTIRNAISGYQQSTVTSADGLFRLSNIPPNPYHLEVMASGFQIHAQDVTIRSAVPVVIKAALAVENARTSVTVEAAGADLLEVDPSAHVDVDRTLIMKLPTVDPGGGLSQAIIYSTGGVAADGNGFFHPLGDHAQVSFVIDGQPISDQQSKVFSTQLPTSAIQSMEAGHRNSQRRVRRQDQPGRQDHDALRPGRGAGLRQRRRDLRIVRHRRRAASGSASATRRSGNFLAVDGVRSGRFLDTPEFTPFHDNGNNADHLRSLRLSAQRPGRLPPEPVRGAQLDPDSQHLRPAGAGSARSACSPGASLRATSTRSTPTRC